jgi:tetratricopeptide (TPR) repeat protein
MALTKSETPWRPDPALVERLMRVNPAEIEKTFPTMVEKSQRLQYATVVGGMLLLKSKDEPRAEKYLNIALVELNGLEPESYAGDVYFLLMLLAERRHDSTALLKYGQMIYPALEREGPMPSGTRVTILNMMSRTYYTIGDFPAALKWAQRLVIQADKGNLPLLQGEAYFALAEANYKLGDLHQAAKAADRAKEFYASAGNEAGLGNAEKVLANVKMARDNKTEAEQHYRKAIEHYERVRDEHGLGNCYFNLGALFKAGQKWPEAIKAFEESIFHFTSAGAPGGTGMAKTQLGAVLMETGELVKARVHLEEAKTLLVRDNALNRLAELNFILGTLHEKLNEVAAARSAYEECRQLYQNANDSERMKPVQEAIERLTRKSER